MTENKRLLLLVLMLVATLGCKPTDDSISAEKPPRPVSVISLIGSAPARFDRVTGTVASWKTDKIGFEVAGRVEFIIEPETDIFGKVYREQGEILTEGTPLARLDPTRYTLNVESVKAQIRNVEKQRDAAQIEIDRVIPAQSDAAKAERDLAQTEVERNEKLVAENAAPLRALDLAKSKLDAATANLAQIAATKEAKRAGAASLEAETEQLQQSLKDAQRDVADCELFSFFPGQVAEVHVVPGSYVQRGQPVATVQMMDPIQVEFEASPATTRRVNYRDEVDVYISQPDQSMSRRMAFIYMIDPVADPQTRTFTITLMVRNEKVRTDVPDALKDHPFARTDLITTIIHGLVIRPNVMMVSEKALHKDDQGSYLWRIISREPVQTSSIGSQVLKVEKLRVIPGDLRLPVLGLATFRDIKIKEGETCDPSTDRFVGTLILSPDASDGWSGDTVLYDRPRWLLRPGDLVGVDLSGGQTTPGFYLPQDAIMEKSGTNYVFRVDESEAGDRAKRIEVTVSDQVGTLRRVEPAGEGSLTDGMKIVAAGAAFVVDGDRINVSEEIDVRR